jgi:hypothetical protein
MEGFRMTANNFWIARSSRAMTVEDICTIPSNNVIFPSTVVAAEKEKLMSDLNLVLGWGSPIGIGIFLICLGAMIHLLATIGDKKKL